MYCNAKEFMQSITNRAKQKTIQEKIEKMKERVE